MTLRSWCSRSSESAGDRAGLPPLAPFVTAACAARITGDDRVRPRRSGPTSRLAQLGASAALLGLVFVGMSINLKEFVGTPLLVNRALEAIVLLATVLVAATAVLIPHQSREVVGVELLAIGVLTVVVGAAAPGRACTPTSSPAATAAPPGASDRLPADHRARQRAR